MSSKPAEKFPLAFAFFYGWSFFWLAVITSFSPFVLPILPLAVIAFWHRGRLKPQLAFLIPSLGGATLLTLAARHLTEASGHLLGVGGLSVAVFIGALTALLTFLDFGDKAAVIRLALAGILLVATTLSTDPIYVGIGSAVGFLLFIAALREVQVLTLNLALILPSLIVTVLTLSLSYTAFVSDRYLSELLRLFSVVPTSGVQFPPTSSLDSLQRYGGDSTVVLRAYGKNSPPYLVGRTFTRFDDEGSWKWVGEKSVLDPSFTLPNPDATDLPLQSFLQPSTTAREKNPPTTAPIRIDFPRGGSGYTLYVPRNFWALAANLPRVLRYDDKLWQVDPRDSFSGSYYLYPYQGGWQPDAPPPVLSAQEQQECLDLPPNLTPVAAQLAQDVAGSYPIPKEKARRITTFFQTQFTYGYEFPFKSRKTALEEFLLSRPPAHCEFFATATALMLRTQGVPTRYINGFVIQEQSLDGSYYVIRLKHAHAWIEAYLPGEGWVVFDPTPPGVLGDPNEKSHNIDAILERFVNWWQHLTGWLSLSPTEMIASLQRTLKKVNPQDLLRLSLSVLVIYALARVIKRRRQKLQAKQVPAFPYVAGRHPQLSPLLDQVQQSLNPAEWRRQPWETLTEWLTRLKGSSLTPVLLNNMTRFAELYQRMRFDSAATTEELATLEELVVKLQGELKGKSWQPREPQPLP